MIRAIVASSVRLRALMTGLTVVLVIGGIIQLSRMPVDVVPEFMPPTVNIQTEALGLSADEVEQLITVPMEQDLLNGIPWLDQIRSDSMPGLSSIELVFKRGTDMLHARQMTQERLSQAHALPPVGTPPVMIQPLSSTSRVMIVGVTSTKLSPIEVSVLARWKIRPRLMGLPGVANVAIWGQRDRQLQVQVDPSRLRSYGVQLDQIVQSTGNSLWVSPLTFVEASTPGTGGFIDTPNQRFSIQHILPITTASSLAAVTLEGTRGRIIRLGDVAKVTEDHQPLIGDAVLNGGPGLMLVVQKFPEANTRQVTHEVENALATMAPGLGGIHFDTTVYRPASYVDAALHNLSRGAVLSAILAILLIGILLGSWRAALIALVSIPLSLLVATWVLYLYGATFNSMVVVGFLVALGVVVDEAVVAVESIRRRLHAANDDTGSDDEDAAEGVISALAQTRPPLIYACAVTLVAAVPLLLLSGVAGAFSKALVAAYALAVFASMAVALTVTASLAVLLLPREADGGRASTVMAAVHRGFDRAAHHILHPRRVYAAAATLALAATAAVAASAGTAMPQSRDRQLLVHWNAMQGTSLTEMDRITAAVSKELRSIRGIDDVGAHVGRAVTGDQIVDVNSADLWVSMSRSADYDATLAAVRSVLNGYPGLRNSVATYPQDRVRAAETGVTAPLAVRVYGTDLRTLAATGERVRQLISSVKGVVAPKVDLPVYQPTLELRLDLPAAQRYGLKPGDIRRATATLLEGILVGNLYENQAIFEVVVKGTPTVRHNPASVQDLVIDTPTGRHVRLGDVASVAIKPDAADIKHDSVLRTVDVTAQVHGRDLGAVIKDVRARVGAMPMPLEYHAQVVSDLARQQSADRRVWAVAAAAAIGAFLLLQAALSSWGLAALVLLTLPLAGVGGVLVAPFVGGVRTVAGAAAIFAVLALALRNILVMLRRYRELEQEEGATFGPQTVLRGTRERVTPVVVSALTTAAAVFPFLLVGRLAGTEIVFPMAAVILGGLVTSTLFTLLVLPAVYLHFAPGARARRVDPQRSASPSAG